MSPVTRRQFLKRAGGGMAALVVGSQLPWVFESPGFTAVQTQALNFRITDAMKQMVTHNAINDARCYFWIYRSASPNLPAECPGPVILASKGDTVNITLTNDLDEDHSFFIPGIVDTGAIRPGETVVGSFTVNSPGAYLYYDRLNEPVNRMMGLHGALVVMPTAAAAGHKFTPYDNPTTHVQALYDDFGGTSAHWPGLAWEQGDAATNVPPFRSYVWLTHQASPVLFAEVGSLPAGQNYSSDQFMERFLRDPFNPLPNSSRLAQYFTINGQSGHFAHNNPTITPMGRVGEPCVVHILNAGLWTHSMHLHANHFFVTSINNVVQENPLWVDVYNIHPMDLVDYTVPFMRPPDLPNARGIGRPDTPRTGAGGRPVWPPFEELDVYMPAAGELIAKDINGNNVDLKQRQSPLCYPMHDHSEPSQTAQGGNYNCGLISGIYFVGDRNTSGQMDFPMDEDFDMMFGNIRGFTGTGPAAPPRVQTQAQGNATKVASSALESTGAGPATPPHVH